MYSSACLIVSCLNVAVVSGTSAHARSTNLSLYRHLVVLVLPHSVHELYAPRSILRSFLDSRTNTRPSQSLELYFAMEHDTKQGPSAAKTEEQLAVERQKKEKKDAKAAAKAAKIAKAKEKQAGQGKKETKPADNNKPEAEVGSVWH